MGITIVQRSNLNQKRPHAKTALVLAGGAITGGTFKVGGLKALNDFLVNKKVTDFDIYIGLSAGGFLAAPLAGGISPEEMLKSLDGTSHYFTQLSPLHFYWPNFREYFQRPLSYLYRRATYLPGILYDFVTSFPNLWPVFRENFLLFTHHPSYSNFEAMMKPLAKVVYSSRSMPSIAEAFPSGIFDNSHLERYLRLNMERNRLTNNFKTLYRARGKALYIAATDIDTSERVIFGHDEKSDVTISQAVQASSAMPGFYKPARLKGIDYVDGAVRRTTNMDIAIKKGAELIICYNPFRPFSNRILLEYLREEDKYVTKNRRISDNGILMVFNQVFRTLLHTRVRYFIEQVQNDPQFKGDVILIEPKEDDATFFEMNPFAFWNRAKAAKHGFTTVRESIEARFGEISKILSCYGIEMTREIVDLDYSRISKPTSDDVTVMSVLEKESPKKGSRSRRLRLVANA